MWVNILMWCCVSGKCSSCFRSPLFTVWPLNTSECTSDTATNFACLPCGIGQVLHTGCSVLFVLLKIAEEGADWVDEGEPSMKSKQWFERHYTILWRKMQPVTEGVFLRDPFHIKPLAWLIVHIQSRFKIITGPKTLATFSAKVQFGTGTKQS